MPVYAFEAESNIGKQLFVEVTQNGGRIVLLTMHKSGGVEGINKFVSANQAQETAGKFAAELGFNAEPVRISKAHGKVFYITLAPVVNGVIVYPDTVKIAVDKDGVCSFDSFNYLANNKKRVVEAPAVSAADAKKLISKSMSVTDYTLVLVSERSKEVLCWEFECKSEDGVHYIYIDANQKREAGTEKIAIF